MKISEARQIVSTMAAWQFVLMGVAEAINVSNVVDLKGYSLSDLVKANNIVDGRNKQSSGITTYHEGLGRNVRSKKMQITVDDRVIAGIYFAMNYEADGQIKALIGDKGVKVVQVNNNDNGSR